MIALLLLLSIGVRAEPVTSTVTLSQCYEWARASSEVLRMRREDIQVSKMRARASIAGALPRLEWNLYETYQDPTGVKELEAQGFGGFVQREQTETRFTVTQPLFSGLREYSALKGFQRQKARDELFFSRAEKDLYERVATLYYDVLARETEAESTRVALKLAENRAKELEQFLRLGKARDSEVFSARAQAAGLKATLETAGALIGGARAELSRVVHQDLSNAPLADDPAPPAPEALDASLARAKDRTDVRALREEVQAKHRRVNYERGQYFPDIDASGNYYTRRAQPFMRPVDWDVQLTMRVPIFQGGGVSAAVQAAQAEERSSQAALEALQNDVEASVRKLHRELTASFEVYKALEIAARAAQDAYDALMKEYRLGLTTNLEVLTALDDLQSQSLRRDAARYRLKKLAVSFNTAVETAQ